MNTVELVGGPLDGDPHPWPAGLKVLVFRNTPGEPGYALVEPTKAIYMPLLGALANKKEDKPTQEK